MKSKIPKTSGIISVILLIVTLIILWWNLKININLIITTIFIGLLILYDILFLVINKKIEEKIIESPPLMRHRMHRSLTHAILFLGAGIPLFIGAWNNGLLTDIKISIISILLILIGIGIYEIGYVRRDKLIEISLIKSNKKNEKHVNAD